MLTGLDKVYREIEQITSVASGALDTILKTSTAKGESSGITVFKKKRSRNSDGSVNLNTLIVDKITLDSWAIKKLNTFFREWKSSNYARGVTGFDGLIVDDNNYASRVIDENITTPLSIALVKYSKILFSTVENLTLYDVITDVGDGVAGDGDDLYDDSVFKLRSTCGCDTFNSSDDYTEYASNFINNIGVSFWLSLIRNHQTPELLGNGVPGNIDIRTLSTSTDASSDVYTETSRYNLSTGWHALDIMGYEGDGVRHTLGGKSWNILSDSISAGVGSHSLGTNSFSVGYGALAVGENSLAVMSNISTSESASAFGCGNIAGAFVHEFVVKNARVISSNSSCEDICNSSSEIDSIELDIYLSGTIGNDLYSIVDGENAVNLFILSDIYGNLYKKGIVGQVTGIVDSADGSVLTILLQGNYQYISNGYVSRSLSDDSEVSSKFVLGQYNRPSDAAIFQVGTGMSDDIRDTFVELGFKSEMACDPYFKIGSYLDNNMKSLSEYRSFLNVSNEYLASIVDDSEFILYDTNISMSTASSGSLVMSTDTGIALSNTSATGYLNITSSAVTFGYDDSSVILKDSGNIVLAGVGNIELHSLSTVSLAASTDISMVSRDSYILGIYDYTEKVWMTGTKYVNVSDSISIDVSLHDITVSSSSTVTGDGSMTIKDGTVYIDSILSISNRGSQSEITWAKNPRTGFNHTKYDSDGDTGLRAMKSSGFYRYLQSNNSLIDISTVPGTTFGNTVGNHVLASRHDANTGWFLGTDGNYASEDAYGVNDGVWLSRANSNYVTEWKRLAYRDEVASIGMHADYKYYGAFAVFNVHDSDANESRSSRISNVGVARDSKIPQSSFTTDSTRANDGVAYIDIDYSNTTPFVNIQGSNDGNPSYSSKVLVGIKNPSIDMGGYLGAGSMAIETAAFSKVGTTVYFDFTIGVYDIDNNITVNDSDEDDKNEYGILLVLGKNNPELFPQYACMFDQQNKSFCDHRYKLSLSPMLGGGGMTFLITRQDEGNFTLFSDTEDDDTNDVGVIGSGRMHFTGQYRAYDATVIPYLNLDDE